MTAVFTLQATDRGARAGLLETPHGTVPTPAFMPVATQASVKALGPDDVRRLGATMLLCNAYHLMLRPGTGVIRRAGGLHRFMGWDGPVLTDSGGFQAYSLGLPPPGSGTGLSRITDEGVIFKSHIDGSLHLLTPESSIAGQEALGADIIMPLDDCVAYGGSRKRLEEAVQRTHDWAIRARGAKRRGDQALFGIVQGGTSPCLRERSASGITALDFPGYAIGGLAVGEAKHEMYRIVEHTIDLLPQDRPRYLMGVGSPEDLVESVLRGVDLFDCALPTRVARNGALFTPDGRVNVTNARFREMDGPFQEGCDCYTCRTFSGSYLHHLFRARELLAYRLATLHNLRFVIRLMEDLRSAILTGRIIEYTERFLERYRPARPQRPDRSLRPPQARC